jgi:hypothetical protein
MNKSIIPKSKYGVKYNDPAYFKTKNKQYYQDNIKQNPNKSKATLINYYKTKYGAELVLNLIETLGLEQALNQLRIYKNELKQAKNSNPLLAITLPTLECY